MYLDQRLKGLVNIFKSLLRRKNWLTLLVQQQELPLSPILGFVELYSSVEQIVWLILNKTFFAGIFVQITKIEKIKSQHK